MKRKAFQAAGTTISAPYSQAVEVDGWVYLSGQIPMDFETGQLVKGDIGGQAAQCFTNLKRVLDAADLTFENVVKVLVFLTDMADFGAVNEVYQTYFDSPYPARSCIAVAALPVGAQIEIELVARR